MTIRILAALLVCCLAAVAQTTYYFDQSAGNDSNDGLTPATAKQSLSWFNANCQDGDTALIEGGDTQTTLFAPTANNTILASWGIGRGIIDTSAGPTTAILIDDVQGTTVVNIEVDSANNGIYLDGDVSLTTIAGCYVHDCAGNGLNSGNTASGAAGIGVLVVDSTFEGNGIDGLGCRGAIHITMRRCLIADNVQDGASAHENGTIRAYDTVIYGSEDGFNHVNDSGTNIIERCWVYGCPGGDCVAIAASSGTYVDAETIIRNSVLVLDASAPVVADSCVRTLGGNIIIDGCVLENPNTSAVRTYNVYSGGAIAGGTDVSVTNTIFLGANDVDAVYAFIVTNADARILRWDNNIYEERAAATAPFRLDSTGGFLTYAQWRAGATTLGGGPVDAKSRYTSTANIALVDRANIATDPANAKPTAASLAYGNGARVDGVSSGVDYARLLRNPRIWDIGAFALSTVADTSATFVRPEIVDLGPHYDATTPVFSRGWSIGAFGFLDLTALPGSGTDREWTSGRRIRIRSGSQGVATFAFGYDQQPATITGGVGAARAGTVSFAFPGELDLRLNRAPTSIAAVGGPVSIRDVAVTVYP